MIKESRRTSSCISTRWWYSSRSMRELRLESRRRWCTVVSLVSTLVVSRRRVGWRGSKWVLTGGRHWVGIRSNDICIDEVDYHHEETQEYKRTDPPRTCRLVCTTVTTSKYSRVRNLIIHMWVSVLSCSDICTPPSWETTLHPPWFLMFFNANLCFAHVYNPLTLFNTPSISLEITLLSCHHHHHHHNSSFISRLASTGGYPEYTGDKEKELHPVVKANLTIYSYNYLSPLIF